MNSSDNNITNHSEDARNLFTQGYNCSQAVFAAFSDITGFDKQTALRISSPFGGGMGRMREVCGAYSAVLMVLGIIEGTDNTADSVRKKELYEKVRFLADEFKQKNGSIICRELLGIQAGDNNAEPAPRTPDYYKKRPCADIVASAAEILDEYFKDAK